jgi:predicted DNA-binding transcriptional regulator AlpA
LIAEISKTIFGPYDSVVGDDADKERIEMATATTTLEALLNEHDVARITGLSVASVRRWRLLRQGPKYIKIGATVRYRPEDISAWLESRPTGGEHQAEA